MNITRINKFEAKEGKARALRDFLASILPSVGQSSGCVSSQLLQNQTNENEFVILEVWTSVEAHQASLKNVPSEKISEVMLMLVGPPVSAYYAP